jgi:uracil-DNA glycosylase family 4
MIPVPAIGPVPARILIVGEAPGADEELRLEPFVGLSGQELSRMLHEAGIARTECRITNVCLVRPPDNEILHFFKDKKGFVPGEEIVAGQKALELEVYNTKPHVIIAMGDTALWACAGKRGITSWRGSTLESIWGVKCIPTYHPAAILRMWEWRAITVHDLRRAERESHFPELTYPSWRFLIRPDFSQVMATLDFLLQQAKLGALSLAVDIETRNKQIACIGIAWSKYDALCIPILCTDKPEGYWAEDEEIAITLRLRDLLTHPHISVVGQNFAYDAQYFAKEYGYIPHLGFDTMVAQHVAFAGLPKALHFLSSMYCTFHQYWKDEGKNWDPRMPEERLWVYNCRDCVATFELRDELFETLEDLNLLSVFQFRMALWPAVVQMMLRGVRIDKARRNEMAGTLLSEIAAREVWINSVLEHPINVRSPKQMQTLFYTDFGFRPVFNRKTKTVTLNDEALEKLVKQDPCLRPLVRNIQELRSLGVFLSTFVQAELDTDGRMRCSFNIAGPETYRFSSSENAFGSGTNLQNIPKGDEDKDGLNPAALRLPNIRKLFIPDAGHIIADVDLSGADAQVVAWEAEDEYLKSIFRSGAKLHAVNAKDIFGNDAGADGRREPYYSRAKMGVHATNYGASARRIAEALGITVHEAERFQSRWFNLHPGIREWHRHVANLLATKREVRNKFGYRRFYFERIEGLLPEALAWIPQSTVAHVSEAGLLNVYRNQPDVHNLLQVHDSIVIQYLPARETETLRALRQNLLIPVPYSDPLIIQCGLKTSARSWGECEDKEWPN